MSVVSKQKVMSTITGRYFYIGRTYRDDVLGKDLEYCRDTPFMDKASATHLLSLWDESNEIIQRWRK